MDGGGAFGGVKAGSQVDPMSYLRKPSVVFRIGALLLSVLMFAMISNQAWQPNSEGNEYCIINNTGILHFLMYIYVSVDIHIISIKVILKMLCAQNITALNIIL